MTMCVCMCMYVCVYVYVYEYGRVSVCLYVINKSLVS
jgi:hypothetical protein